MKELIFKHKKAIIIAVLVFMIVYIGCAIVVREKLMDQYNVAVEELENGDYQKAIEHFTNLGDYQDSFSYIKLAEAEQALLQKDYETASKLFCELGTTNGFEKSKYAKISAAKIEQNEELYVEATQQYEEQNYGEALNIFNGLEGYKDSEVLAEECRRDVKILMRATTLVAGTNATAGITETGEVNFAGARVLTPKDVEGWSDVVSIALKGSLVLGLKLDGSVLVGGSVNRYRIDTSTWQDIVSIAAGDLYIVGLREDGTLVAQGHNGDGQVDIGEWKNIVAISAGWRHTVGLDEDGKVYITGISADKQLQEIAEASEKWSDIVAISAGGSATRNYGESGHTVGLKRDGTVVAVGDNDQGQCEVETWQDIVAISAGAYHTVGLRSDGTVVTTLNNSDANEINQWQDIVAVSAGYNTTFGLKKNGSIVSVGYDRDGQRDTDNWGEIIYWPEQQYIFRDVDI